MTDFLLNGFIVLAVFFPNFQLEALAGETAKCSFNTAHPTFTENVTMATPIGMWNGSQSIPTIPCSIGNSPSGTCLLDSGAAVSIVSKNRNSLALSILCEDYLQNAVGFQEKTPGVASDIRIGDTLDVRGNLFDLTNAYPGLPEFSGVVGADILRLLGRFVLDLNGTYGPMRQSLIAVDGSNSNDFSAFRDFGDITENTHGLITLISAIGGAPADSLLDTASQESWVSKQFVKSHPSFFRMVSSEMAGGGSITSAPQQSAKTYELLKPICFQDSCVRIKYIYETDSETDANDLIIGQDVSFQLSWYLDLQKKIYSVIWAK